jgi:Tfp pilus assembly protein PilO
VKKKKAQKAGKPQTWLITALLASGSVAYVVFLFLPTQRSIHALRSQVQERRQQIVQGQSMVRTVAQARLRLAAANEVGQQWRDQSPQQSEVSAHLASLTKHAQAAGVAIDRLDPLPPVDLQLLSEQNISLHFHAPFAKIFDLLERLESIPGSLWIRDLRLQASSDASDNLRGELTLPIFVDRTD